MIMSLYFGTSVISVSVSSYISTFGLRISLGIMKLLTVTSLLSAIISLGMMESLTKTTSSLLISFGRIVSLPLAISSVISLEGIGSTIILSFSISF
ncbi:hypothetical protein H8356DRAFT_1685562 [Neocallimastix lanati (nom. inval.)]|nr:hypothetical protein H8356DRAFT_1685562 [Neocallimastix sp. JGI-2020a]